MAWEAVLGTRPSGARPRGGRRRPGTGKGGEGPISAALGEGRRADEGSMTRAVEVMLARRRPAWIRLAGKGDENGDGGGWVRARGR